MCFLGFGHKWKAVDIRNAQMWFRADIFIDFSYITYVCEKCKKIKYEETKGIVKLEDLQ
ncbi:hypothetical protein EOM39_01115 [Candidatus Gracilibacteria bacterium]|nr:hypothetical protein [Candidatus Gracilibacteria bacterium]